MYLTWLDKHLASEVNKYDVVCIDNVDLIFG